MQKHSLSTEKVTSIFADTDILWNFQVNDAYNKLSHLFPNARTFIYPPASFLNESGALNLTKQSTEDWITEDLDQEVVFSKVVSVSPAHVREQLNVHFAFQVETSAKKQEKKIYTKVRAFLEEYVLFVPDTALYYVFNAQTKLWEPMDIDKLTYHTLRHLEEGALALHSIP